jgi:ATP-binding cassette subfamily B protein
LTAALTVGVTVPPSLQAFTWGLGERERLTARLAEAAGLTDLGPGRRFELSYADFTPAPSRRARAMVPAVLRVGAGAGTLIGVLGFAAGEVRLLAPDGRTVGCPAFELVAWLRSVVEADRRPAFDAAVARAGIETARAAAVSDALCVAALGSERIAEGVQLRPAQRSLGAALAAGGAARRLAVAVAAYLAQLVLFAGLWWMVGARALAQSDGPPSRSVAVIAAVIAALVSARLAASWTAGRLAVDVGESLRERLLDGVLALDPEPLRAEGIGQLLGRVVETEALESLALGGGLVAAAGLFELVTGAVILAFGVRGGWMLGLLGGWLGLSALVVAGGQAALRRWSALRLTLTHDLVERMAGQRTLVAQQPPELWHREEEAALDRYERAGRALDRRIALVTSFLPRGWIVAAVALLAPSLPGAAGHPGAFAVSLGGVLFIYGALRKLAQSSPALGAAALAWQQVAPLFRPADAAPSTAPSPPPSPPGTAPVAGERPLIAARELTFRYPGRTAPVLSGCAFELRRGDRVLLEGASGSGKSTLGSLLAGLRRPDTGQLLLDGVDQSALGLARWRAQIGSAPQFHENHVFSHTLLFNLLLGRAWPPRREDVAEAEAVLRELDLGPLLERMPSGLEQLIGESGWQLSHGERSRLFIARSLLQPLDARVLDESFAALDPETLERALACVRRRADTLVVIAHP